MVANVFANTFFNDFVSMANIDQLDLRHLNHADMATNRSLRVLDKSKFLLRFLVHLALV